MAKELIFEFSGVLTQNTLAMSFINQLANLLGKQVIIRGNQLVVVY